VIGRKLDVPAVGIPTAAAAKHFSFLAPFVMADNPASSELTREQLGWAPRERGLIADLEQGPYFETSAAGSLSPVSSGTVPHAQSV